jgi:hypothetical protein
MNLKKEREREKKVLFYSLFLCYFVERLAARLKIN